MSYDTSYKLRVTSYCIAGNRTWLYRVPQSQIIVTDGERGESMDPGENGAILDAGGDEGLGPPGRGKSGQLASDSGGG
jgi:hypothetical protein